MKKQQNSMKDYISFSEYDLFQKDRLAYYSRYIMGIEQEPTEPMLYGRFIHEMLQNKFADDKIEREAEKFGQDKIRVAKQINKWEVPERMEIEKLIKVPFQGDISIMGYLDFCGSKGFYEIKTSSSFWTQEMADESMQMTMYFYLFYTEYGKMPDAFLVNFNTKNGKMKTFTTERTFKDFHRFEYEIEQFVKELKRLKWWERRI